MVNGIRPWANHKEISKLSYAELVELYDMAKKATKGPWDYDIFSKEVTTRREKCKSDANFVCCLGCSEYHPVEDEDMQDEVGTYIAHTHPGVVKYLLREIAKLRYELFKKDESTSS